jgi:hypothetical protein
MTAHKKVIRHHTGLGNRTPEATTTLTELLLGRIHVLVALSSQKELCKLRFV